MRKRLLVAAALVAAATVASLLAVSLASASRSAGSSISHWTQNAPPGFESEPGAGELSPGGQTLVLIENETQGQNTSIDVGDPGPSPGDYVVFRDPLYNQDQSQRVGAISVQCMDLYARFLCHGTGELTNKGTFTFEGVVPNTPKFTLALTGGTRSFPQLDGNLRIQPGVPGNGLDTLTLQMFD